MAEPRRRKQQDLPPRTGSADEAAEFVKNSCAWCYAVIPDDVPFPKVVARLAEGVAIPGHGMAAFQLGANVSHGWLFAHGFEKAWAGTILFLACSGHCEARLRAHTDGRTLTPIEPGAPADPPDQIDGHTLTDDEIDDLVMTCAWCGSRLQEDAPAVEIYAHTGAPIAPAQTLVFIQSPDRRVHAVAVSPGQPNHDLHGFNIVFLNCSSACADDLSAALEHAPAISRPS